MSSILIIGTYRQTLTVIRSLSRAGNKVILGIGENSEACEYSRYVDEIWKHLTIESDPERFIQMLRHYLLDHPEITSVFPVGEKELQLFSIEYDRVPHNVRLLMCDPGTVMDCLDKPTMSTIADELEIPQARWMTVSDSQALFAASDSIGYPCVVRPSNSSAHLFDKKAMLFRSAASIREQLSNWPPEIASLIVQEYVPGPRRNVYFFSVDGHIEALAEVAILRTDRLDGTGLAVSGMTVKASPDLVRYCKKMALRLKYQGAGCAQFLLDATSGMTSFLELNPRLGANFAVVYRAGLDLPALQLRLNHEKGHLTASSIQVCKEGVHYAWATGDLTGLKNAIAAGQADVRTTIEWLLAMLKSNLRSSVHITWDRRDPLPTLALLKRSFLSFLNHLKPSRSRQ